ARCEDKKHIAYKDYGGRGIYVVKEWDNFEDFYKDMGNPPFKDASIDRIDNDGPYAPWYCIWSTRIEQAINKRKHNNNIKLKKIKQDNNKMKQKNSLKNKNIHIKTDDNY